MNSQELITFGIVGIALLSLGLRFFKSYLAVPLSQLFLKQGKVKFALFLRRFDTSNEGCHSCECGRETGKKGQTETQ